MFNPDKNVMLCIVFICLVNWTANFWQISRFGLYIDDYSRIPQAIETSSKSFSDQLSFVFNADLRVRPLHNYLINGFALVGNKLGGLRAIYVIGYIISTVNTLLLFFLFRRICDKRTFALVGALTFCLYPIAETKIWLTSLLGIQPALTFLLVAMHTYLSGYKFIPHVLMLVSLFCYESIYPVFMAAPLLLKQNVKQNFFREITRHVLITSAIFAGFIGLKFSLMDPRIGHLDYGTTLQAALKNILAGPIFNLKKHLSIAIRNIMQLPRKLFILQFISFTGLLLFFWMNGRTDSSNGSGCNDKSPSRLTRGKAFQNTRIYIRLLATGLVMLALGYIMSFYGSIYHYYGIASRIHTAAAFGAALSLAALATMVLQVSSRKCSAMVLILLAFGYASFITYNFKIQDTYVASRDQQHRFWTELIALCPDVTEGTLILVSPDRFSTPWQHYTLNWSQSRVLDKLFQFPEAWHDLPRVYPLPAPDQKNACPLDQIITAESLAGLAENNVLMDIEPNDIRRKIDIANTIVLTSEGGTLHRPQWLESADHTRFRLKPKSDNTVGKFKHGVLYTYLIK